MSPIVVTLACGHERWAPMDWNGTALLECRECRLHAAVRSVFRCSLERFTEADTRNERRRE